MIPIDRPPRLRDGGPGVSRFELASGRYAAGETARLVHRWARDRALPARTVDDLCALTCTALGPATAERSGSVCVRLRWTDLDHVRVDVEWHEPDGAAGVAGAASGPPADEALRMTAATMDARTVSWGVEREPEPRVWMIVDTR